MGSTPYLQFKPSNVTRVMSIVKVTTVYRSFVLVRVGLGIFYFAISRFVYASKKAIVRGLGMLKPQRQLNDSIDWLGTIHKALPELELV